MIPYEKLAAALERRAPAATPAAPAPAERLASGGHGAPEDHTNVSSETSGEYEIGDVLDDEPAEA